MLPRKQEQDSSYFKNQIEYFQGKYPIISKKTLAKEIYDMEILCPDVAEEAQAGQFVNIKADGYMLRRPISICGIDKNKGILRVVFEVRGKGTKVISMLREGDMIDIVAPLGGHGFELLPKGKKAVIIGGGIGNLIDRIFYGFVVDYISVSFFPPVCNFADYCITVGTLLLIVYVLFFSNVMKSEKKVNKSNE